MKTNKSAPLNLCAPVGVTGTTLPAHPKAFDLGIVQPSPVKDTPDFSGLAPIFDKAELASMKSAASIVESVGLPDLPLRAFQMSGKGGYVILMDDEGRNIASISDRFGADARMKIAESLADGVNSHAAKDAKIRDLELALSGLLVENTIAEEIHRAEQETRREEEGGTTVPNVHNARLLKAVSVARAALALPCAPLGS